MPRKRLDIVHPKVARYLESLVPPRDRVLAEMEARAEREDIPIVGPLVGRLFYQLALMTGAKRVMELGSAIGYSTMWWARGVGEGGEVWYTDASEENAHDAIQYLERGGVAQRVHFMVGDAVQCMAAVKGKFDIVFCDIDKPGYPAALRAAMPRLRRGGLLVVDNTLWRGWVASRWGGGDSTKAVRRLNQLTYADDDAAFAVLIPLRDGVSVVVKR
ncbi:MAG TPA: O-methyltransferase [Gemmatimonadales bacterium]|nr:O-methyltransferase [Gemmatimonadales bacterium]